MYEFNGWAVVVANEGTDAANDELMGRLLDHIAGLDEMTRERFHWDDAGLNGHRAIMVAGLRNHPDPFVTGVFQWLAEQSRRAYGLLYTLDDSWGDPNRFDVWRLRRGELTFHADPFFD